MGDLQTRGYEPLKCCYPSFLFSQLGSKLFFSTSPRQVFKHEQSLLILSTYNRSRAWKIASWISCEPRVGKVAECVKNNVSNNSLLKTAATALAHSRMRMLNKGPVLWNPSLGKYSSTLDTPKSPLPQAWILALQEHLPAFLLTIPPEDALLYLFPTLGNIRQNTTNPPFHEHRNEWDCKLFQNWMLGQLIHSFLILVVCYMQWRHQSSHKRSLHSSMVGHAERASPLLALFDTLRANIDVAALIFSVFVPVLATVGESQVLCKGPITLEASWSQVMCDERRN